MNKRIIGFAIISVTLVAIGIWEFWGRENISYRSVLVLKEDAPSSTVITEEDIGTKRVETPSGKALRPGDEEMIIGLATAQYVAGDGELRREYFCKPDFLLGEDTGRELLSVPMDWISSCPQTIRRGDEVTFYIGKVKLLSATVAYAKDSGGEEVKSLDKDRLSASSVVSHIEIIAETESLVELASMAGEGKRFTLVTSQ